MKMDTEKLQLGFIWYVVFVFSIVFHEFAHAFMAYRFGDHTAHYSGLTTLNPLPHIQRSPFGMVIIPLISFVMGGWMIGWASTPYDPYWAQRYPKQAAWMALAGPGANLLLVILAGVLIHIGISAGIFSPPKSINFTTVVEATANGFPKGAAVMVSILFTLNVLLLIFNLIPMPPLDGTAIAELILEGESLNRYRALIRHPNLQMFGLFVAWYVIKLIFWPIFIAIINILYFWRGFHYG